MPLSIFNYNSHDLMYWCIITYNSNILMHDLILCVYCHMSYQYYAFALVIKLHTSTDNNKVHKHIHLKKILEQVTLEISAQSNPTN